MPTLSMPSQVEGNEASGQVIALTNPVSAVTAGSAPGVVGNLPGRSSPGNTSSGMEMKLWYVFKIYEEFRVYKGWDNICRRKAY